MPTETKLDSGQKHILKLIARDAGPDGWTPVSSQVFPLLQTTFPAELFDLESVGDEGRGRARLTLAGQGVLDAMAWL